MRLVLLLIAMAPAWAQFGAAVQVVNGNGVPNPAYCASSNNVGMVYARKDGAAANTTFYVCSNTGASTYEWALTGGGGGTGDVEGGTNLTTSGAIPYVSAAATLDEDGSFLRVSTGKYTLLDPTAVTGDSKFVVKNGAGQAANLQEWQDSGGTAMAGVTKEGYGFFGSTPGMQLRGDTAQLSIFDTSASRHLFAIQNSALIGISAGAALAWSNGNQATGTVDAGFARNGDGIVEVNNGTAGTLRDLIQRHPLAGGTSPTITSGFGTTPSIAGKDAAGRITVGSGGTAATGTITFGTAWATAPVCTAANETTQLALFPTATTTTLVLASTTPFTAADKLVYQCIGY